MNSIIVVYSRVNCRYVKVQLKMNHHTILCTTFMVHTTTRTHTYVTKLYGNIIEYIKVNSKDISNMR
jgi:hypothetical protein